VRPALTIGEQIKKLRKSLNLTQQKFGERIGIKGNTIAQYELDRNKPIDAVVSLICREYNVREEWLRTGEGEMFRSIPSNTLEQLAYEYGLSNAAYALIEKFVKMNDEKRRVLIDFFLEMSDTIIECGENPHAPAFSERSLPTSPKDGCRNPENQPEHTGKNGREQSG